MAVMFYFAPVTFLLSAVLLRSWLSYCPGFDNDQTTCLLFETNVSKLPLGIDLDLELIAILDHSKSPIILMLKFLLLQSGDIQVNPGPPKHPCGLCNKAVQSNQKAIECEECFRWFHINCTAMSTQSYDNFGHDSNLVWICNFCAFPNFSAILLLNNLDSFASNNSYQSLESDNSSTKSAPDPYYSSPMGPPLQTSSPIARSPKQKRKKLKAISLNCNGIKGMTKKVAFQALIDLHKPDIVLGC